jgi:tetratricopeptide (TPR) repeat protein
MALHARRAGRFLSAVGLLLLIAGSLACRLFETRGQAYKRCMECADRANSERAIVVLKVGEFGCTRLPAQVKTPGQARRFYLEEAWKAAPMKADAPVAIAMTYWDEQDFARAREYFEAARERDPQNLSAVIGLISMDRLLGNYSEAMGWAVWIEGLRGVDGKKISPYLRGRILFDEKRYDEAEPLLNDALQRTEGTGFFLGKTGFSMVDAEFYLAEIAIRKGQREKADKLFRSYVKRNHDPDFANYIQLVFSRGVQAQLAMYDEVESCWVRTRQ